MLSLLLALVLTIAAQRAAAGDSGLPSVAHQPRTATQASVTGGITTIGNSIATTVLPLERGQRPYVDPHAEYMSIGPFGADAPEPPDTAATPIGGVQFRIEWGNRHRLRVTVSTAERNTWLTIDDILTGRGDTRAIHAEYRLDPYFGNNVQPLWNALQNAPRILGAGPTGPPITWLSPTAFSWTTYSDTLVIEQKADSLFQVTVRARTQ